MQHAFALFLLLVSGAFSAFELQAAPSYVPLLLEALSVLAFVLGFLARERSFEILGFAVLSLPYFGFQGLNLFVASFLLGGELSDWKARAPEQANRAAQKLRVALAFLLIVYTGSAIRTFLTIADLGILSEIGMANGFRGLAKYIGAEFYRWHYVPLLLEGYVLAFLLVRRLLRTKKTENFLLGMSFGALVSACLLCLQMLSGNSFLSMNRSAFWVLTGRYAGLSTDPNAFGVMAALLVPFMFLYRPARFRALFLACGILLFLSAPWSGSRTFWFGLFVSAAALAWIKCRKHTPAWILFGLLVSLLIFAGKPDINEALQARVGSPGLGRVLKTIHWQHGTEMLESREIYSRLALAVHKESPLFGVGLGEFYDRQVQAAKRLGIDIGAWRDNANNFYLHALAENGWLGFFTILIAMLFLFQAVSLGRRSDENRAAFQVSLLTFFLMLLTGPHLLFDEIKYLFFGLLAVAVQSESTAADSPQAQQRAGLFSLAIFAFIYLIAIAYCSFRETVPTGRYPEEAGADGAFAWTVADAMLKLCPHDKDTTVLELQAMNPDLDKEPLVVSLFIQDDRGGADLKQLTLAQPGWQRIELPLGGIWQEGRELRVEIRVSRTWSPAQWGNPGDMRSLGVMVRHPEDVCSERSQ